MKVILHQIEADSATKRVTLHIQLSESGPIEIRHATYVTVGEKGWKLDCDDNLIGELQGIERGAGMRPGAICGELLVRVRDAFYYPDQSSFPIVMNGTWLKPTKRSSWSRLMTRLRPRST